MATVTLHFRPSSLKDGTGRPFIRLIHRRETRQMSIKKQIKATEWDSYSSSVIIPNGTSSGRVKYLKSVQQHIHTEIERLMSVIRRLDDYGEPYSVDEILKPYQATKSMSDESHEVGFVAYTRRLIEVLRRCGQSAKVERYTLVLADFLKFLAERNRTEVPFERFDFTLMMEYEAWLQGRGWCRNSSSNYLQVLRAAYNRAVDEGLTQQGKPFRRVYTGIDKTQKRAISLADVAKIKALDLSDKPKLAFYRDLWMLSYYLCGIAFCDLAKLRKDSLNNGVLYYSRSKTRHKIAVKWLPEMAKIVNKYNDPASPFLLPIIKDQHGDLRCQCKAAIRLYNHWLKKVGELAGLDTPLTSYVQRHSWASNAKSADIPITVISEALGHNDTTVTAIYLAELDHSRIDKANSKLLKALSAETARQFQAASLREAKAAERTEKAAAKAAAKAATAEAKATERAAAKAAASKSSSKATRTAAEVKAAGKTEAKATAKVAAKATQPLLPRNRHASVAATQTRLSA